MICQLKAFECYVNAATILSAKHAHIEFDFEDYETFLLQLGFIALTSTCLHFTQRHNNLFIPNLVNMFCSK